MSRIVVLVTACASLLTAVGVLLGFMVSLGVIGDGATSAQSQVSRGAATADASGSSIESNGPTADAVAGGWRGLATRGSEVVRVRVEIRAGCRRNERCGTIQADRCEGELTLLGVASDARIEFFVDAFSRASAADCRPGRHQYLSPMGDDMVSYDTAFGLRGRLSRLRRDP